MEMLIERMEQELLAIDLEIKAARSGEPDPRTASLMVESAQLLLTLIRTFAGEGADLRKPEQHRA